jgi:hypothetical protein
VFGSSSRVSAGVIGELLLWIEGELAAVGVCTLLRTDAGLEAFGEFGLLDTELGLDIEEDQFGSSEASECPMLWFGRRARSLS